MPLYWLCLVSAVLNCPPFLHVLCSTLRVCFGTGAAEERLWSSNQHRPLWGHWTQHEQVRGRGWSREELPLGVRLHSCHRRGAHISREERVICHRQMAGQVRSLHLHRVVLPLHPFVVPLYQGGVALVHQLHGGLLHNRPIGQNAAPDPPVVIQDEIPSRHCASSPLLATQSGL